MLNAKLYDYDKGTSKDAKVEVRTSNGKTSYTLVKQKSRKAKLGNKLLGLISHIIFFTVSILAVEISFGLLCFSFSIDHNDYYFSKIIFSLIINVLIINPIFTGIFLIVLISMMDGGETSSRSRTSRKRSKYYQQKIDRSYKPKKPVFFNSNWKTALLDDCKCGYRSYKFVYNSKWKKIICPVCGTVQGEN